MNYATFLQSKHPYASTYGPPAASPLPDALFPFQQAIVHWAVRKGRAAIWANTGLGKTFMQVAWAQALGVKTLILAPLAVAAQTIDEAAKLDIPVQYVRSADESRAAGPIVISNYDMLHALNPDDYQAIVLDESSVLKNLSGATKQALITAFARTPYRLCCTATPAPNDHMELGNHAEFLGVMPSSEMLARWFLNDTMQAGAYRLKAHATEDFWRWLTSWAICCTLPSDIDPSYDDTPYILPPLHIHARHVPITQTAFAKGMLIDLTKASAAELWRDKKATVEARCQAAAAIVRDAPGVPWLLWCHTNEESARLAQLLLKDAGMAGSEVTGSMALAQKESGIRAFTSRQAQILISKPSICGSGLNFQHCNHVLFVGQTYSYEEEYQALRRIWRFGQRLPVEVYILHTDAEENVRQSLERKAANHQAMQRAMVQATRQYGLAERSALTLSVPKPQRHDGTDFTLYEGDCVATLQSMASNSIDLTISSPPFSSLYIYSNSIADLGNSASHEEFFAHLGYLLPELYRATKPGRLCCFHCKDLPLYRGRDGAAGLYDFPGELRKAFERAGWTFHSRITIWKDPVTEMQRTKTSGLLHKNFAVRGEWCRQGMADYVLAFRAWKEDIPDKQIGHTPMPGDFIGEKPPQHWKDTRDYSIQVWQRYASPVWFDINQQRVLQYREARSEDDEKHICPLQLDVIERCLYLWSNPGDVILDPFSGIGSVGHVALASERQYVGCELKPEYVQTSLRNLQAALGARKQLALFTATPEESSMGALA